MTICPIHFGHLHTKIEYEFQTSPALPDICSKSLVLMMRKWCNAYENASYYVWKNLASLRLVPVSPELDTSLFYSYNRSNRPRAEATTAFQDSTRASLLWWGWTGPQFPSATTAKGAALLRSALHKTCTSGSHHKVSGRHVNPWAVCCDGIWARKRTWSSRWKIFLRAVTLGQQLCSASVGIILVYDKSL